MVARIVIGVASILVFSAVAIGIETGTAFVHLDQRIQLAVSGSRSPLINILARLVTPFGFQVVIVIGICVALLLVVKGRWAYFGAWLIVIIGGLLLNVVLKTTFQRLPPSVTNRPDVRGVYSFPSGHAMMSVIVNGLVAYLLLRTWNDPVRRRVVLAFAGGLSFLVGLSRIYLGVHYFSDVLGGFAMGVAWLSLCLTALEALWRKDPSTLRLLRRSGQNKQPVSK